MRVNKDLEPIRLAFQPIKLEASIEESAFPAQGVTEVIPASQFSLWLSMKQLKRKHEAWSYGIQLFLLSSVAPIVLGGSWVEMSKLLMFVIVVLLIAWSIYRVWPAIREELYVVPGGLIARRSGNYARNWKLQQYTPRNAMLFVIETDTKTHLVIAPAGLHPHVQIHLHHKTLQNVLNAWFSRVPPPAEDELADLM